MEKGEEDECDCDGFDCCGFGVADCLAEGPAEAEHAPDVDSGEDCAGEEAS